MFIWAINKDGKKVNINNYRNSDEARLDGPFHDTAELGLRLVPVFSDRKKRHFRVYRDVNTSSGSSDGMSMEHFVAQKVFEKRFRSHESLWVKYYKYDNSKCPGVKVDLKQHYDECIIEQSIQGFRADLLLRDSKGSSPDIMVEVWYTHRCEPQKINSGIPIIEFKIRSFDDLNEIIRNWGLIESDINKNQYNVRFFNFRNGRNCFPWPENGDDDSSYVPISKR